MATALLLAALLFLPSCFTMGLWGFDATTEPGPNGRDQNVFVYDEETQWSWAGFFARVLMTPFALGLDVLTAPVQAFFLADDDDCGPR